MLRSFGHWTPSGFLYFLFCLFNYHLISLSHCLNCSHLPGLSGNSVINAMHLLALIPSLALTPPAFLTNSTVTDYRVGTISKMKTLQRWSDRTLYPPPSSGSTFTVSLFHSVSSIRQRFSFSLSPIWTLCSSLPSFLWTYFSFFFCLTTLTGTLLHLIFPHLILITHLFLLWSRQPCGLYKTDR